MREVPTHWPWLVATAVVGGVAIAVTLGLLVRLALWLVG